MLGCMCASRALFYICVMVERLLLLCGVTSAFCPGVLTALVGKSGTGKTMLMDVLAGQSLQLNHFVCK